MHLHINVVDLETHGMRGIALELRHRIGEARCSFLLGSCHSFSPETSG
jgi:hypothetical protein